MIDGHQSRSDEALSTPRSTTGTLEVPSCESPSRLPNQPRRSGKASSHLAAISSVGGRTPR